MFAIIIIIIIINIMIIVIMIMIMIIINYCCVQMLVCLFVRLYVVDREIVVNAGRAAPGGAR